MSPEPALKLHALISSLFTAPELRAWVWLHDAARPVHDTLPGEVASTDELVQALLVGLTHRGLINDALLGALVAVPMRLLVASGSASEEAMRPYDLPFPA